jgi:hypothetical protein
MSIAKNQQRVFYFGLVNADRTPNTTATPVVMISKDGGDLVASTNAPQKIGTSHVWSIILTATEMNCDVLFILVTADNLVYIQTTIFTEANYTSSRAEALDNLDAQISDTATQLSINALATDLANLDGDVANLDGDVAAVNTVVASLSGSVEDISAGLTAVNVSLIDIHGDLTLKATQSSLDVVAGDVSDIKSSGNSPTNGKVRAVYKVTDFSGTVPIADCTVVITTGEDGSGELCTLVTNEQGEITVWLTQGTQELPNDYYMWRYKAGVPFRNPDKESL